MLVLAAACQRPVSLTAPSPFESRPDFGRVQALLDDAVDYDVVAGAVALVARDDEVLLFETVGLADRESGRPMTADTIFRIASMTKPITSVAALVLVDEGRLDLDAPVARYLPEFADVRVLAPEPDVVRAVPAQRELTVRHLATHTSGIGYRFAGVEPLSTLYAEAGVTDGLVPGRWTLAEQVQRLARVPLLHEPGVAFTYGLSTDVLGRVIEVVAEQPLEDFVRERVLEPLDMFDTHFVLPEEKRARLASVYVRGAGGLVRVDADTRVEGHTRYSGEIGGAYRSGGAGLVSTARDYHRFGRMLLGRGAIDGVRVLSRESADALTRHQLGSLRLPRGELYGLGIAIESGFDSPRPRGSWFWGGFFHTSFWVDPERRLIGVFLAQHPPRDGLHLADTFSAGVYDALPDRADPES